MLDPKRYSIPIKGWNTITPIREMGAEYAPVLENHWFDQAGGMNRRPGQAAITTTPLANTMDSLFEYRDLAGNSSIFSYSNGVIYVQAGAVFNSSLAAVFTARPRAAQMAGAMIVGDAVTARTYTTGGGWAVVTGASPMNMFAVWKGRMIGAGNPAQQMTAYYSDTNAANGVTDWTPAGPGGFLDLTASIGTGDKITGIGTYLGMLVVFLQNAIVFYSGTSASTAVIHKVIRGIGCVSHDTIHGIGNDTMFLSKYGFKKLSEVMVQGDAAAGDASTAINNYVVDQLVAQNVTFASIRACFAEKFGVYLCRFGNLTLAYHVLFDAWIPWYGLDATLYTKEDGTVLTANLTMQQLLTDSLGDTIGAAAEVAVVTKWDSAPFRGSDAETKPRWKFIELIYESVANESIELSTWLNLDLSTMITDVVTLDPEVTAPTPDSMVWSTGAGSTDPRMYWGNVTNGIKWAGSTAGGVGAVFSGDVRIPIIGRSELLSLRVLNKNISTFKITANEVYSVKGGLRP